jgi:hypothetical protein
LVAQLFEAARDPFALGARLEENARRRAIAQQWGEPLAARDDAPLFDAAVVVSDAELTLAFVQIQSYRIHGGWPPGVCLVARR